MKTKLCFIMGALGLFLNSCVNNNAESPIVTQRYVHKYGYAVSKDEWEAKHYPGQVITTLRSGVTVTATYENDVLHGPCTQTYPHSQIVESYVLYNQNKPIKEIRYDTKGMPLREAVQLSPLRRAITTWYFDGCPKSIEEYASDELLEGQYFTMNNELEAHVEKGNGLKIKRDESGLLLAKEAFEAGYLTKRETFYPTGTPESVATFSKGQAHGEKKSFALNGEPASVEEYVNGQLHGKSTYYKNGAISHSISYLNGLKNGLEIHYQDGGVLSQELQWENDKKHGANTYYINGVAQSEWYYDGDRVSKNKYEELSRLDNMLNYSNETFR
jgi:antitoxin component YwqK of YwqJK toxin-antitoxin module